MNAILTSALLGTDKMPLKIEELPHAIAECLEGTVADSPETALLRAASLFYAYNEAGKEAEKLTIPEPKPAPSETRETCPKVFLDFFKNIEDPVHKALLHVFLQKCVDNNWSVPGSHLVGLLELGKTKYNDTNINKNIIHLMGAKGAWLAQLNPEWNVVLLNGDEQESQTKWEEGKLEERIEIFTTLRQSEPALALQKLQAEWAQCSARERKAFLEVFHLNVSAADEPFLESVYEDVMKQKDNDKGIKAEIKKLAIDLLLSIPESRKLEWVFERLTPYFNKKKALLGLGKTQYSLNLPEKEDAFFCKEVMNGQLGRAPSSSKPDYWENSEFWFQDLVAYIPPQKWMAFLEMNANDTFQLFAEHFKGQVNKKFSIAYAALGHAIWRKQLKTYAFEYLKRLEAESEHALTDYTYKSLFLLVEEPKELDAIVKTHCPKWSFDDMLDFLPDIKWTSEMTGKFLSTTASVITDWNYGSRKKTFIPRIKNFDKNCVAEIEDIIEKYNIQETNKSKIREKLLVPTQTYFQLLQILEN